METVNVHQAKTYLSRLLDGAQDGQDFVIAKAADRSPGSGRSLLTNDAVLLRNGPLVQLV